MYAELEIFFTFTGITSLVLFIILTFVDTKRLKSASREKIKRMERDSLIVTALFAVSSILQTAMDMLARGHSLDFDLIWISFVGGIGKRFYILILLIIFTVDYVCASRKRLRELDALAAPPPAPPGG